MKINFEIEENYAVILDGIHIDLHNNFLFKQISETKNEIRLEFEKAKGNWIKENEFNCLSFIHKNVSFEFHKKGDNDEFPEDENTLSSISFFPNSMRDTNDASMEHSLPNKNDDIIYYFENGKTYRFHCDEIELIAKK